MLGVFCNTLTANEKFSFQECENFPSSIQMQLSFKPKPFSDTFVAFLESKSKFKHVEKKI